MVRVLVGKVFPANGAGLSSNGFLACATATLTSFSGGKVPSSKQSHQGRDVRLERSALPQSPAQSDGPRMAPHGFHSFFRVLGAHAFERLVDQIHVPSFEVEVLVLLRISVVRGIL